MLSQLNLDKLNINWEMEPFPHAIINNFLPQETFERISQINPSQLENLKRSNKTSLELNKQEFGLHNNNSTFRIPIEIMGLGEGKKLFKKIIDPSKIITLASFDDFAGYYPYHSSTRNGLLGAHVDHSSLDKLMHFANSIFYVHNHWDNEWGGETILFNEFGLIPEVFIEPKPNRLVLFVHSNRSFHGVNRILCPKEVRRNTYYMDYYLKNSDLKLLNNNLKILGKKKKLYFTYHPTTFIPFFPLGINSFTSGKLKENITYLFRFLIYLLCSINFVTKLRFMMFNQIRFIKRYIFKK